MIDVEPELIQRQLEKVLGSEQLAKADTCRKLLSYLVERSLKDEVPKETAIAFDVFGKDPSFNGAEHSIVRVSVRTLRQKLTEYYAGAGRDDEVRFEIPKGGYRLTVARQAAVAAPALPAAPADADVPGASMEHTVPFPPPRSRTVKWLAAATLAVLAASVSLNLYLWNHNATAGIDPDLARVRSSAMWSDVVRSSRPVTVILGDLFMFTQLDAKTGRTLTVRDAEINSSEELRALLASNPQFATERGQRYVTMIQKAVAISMASVLPIVSRPGRHIEVVARDDITVDEIRNNDIIYVGPLVRLGPLAGHYELRSRYRYNTEGSKITDVSTGKTFLPEGTLGGQHLDYALAAKFVGPTGNHIMIFTAGARNAGTLQIVRTLTSPEGLATIEARLRAKTHRTPGSFEALLTVTGFKQTDLTADIVDVSPMPATTARLQATATALPTP